MMSFSRAPALDCPVIPVRTQASARRFAPAHRHNFQQLGETRSLVSRRGQRFRSRCCAGSAIENREHVASTEANQTTSSTSVSDHNVATVFRWPRAFGSQAVKVTGNHCCSSAYERPCHRMQSINDAAGQALSTTGRILFLLRSPVQVATGLSA